MHQAKKSLGQNFLHDEAVLQMIIDAAELSSEDKVLEIGPGKGALTHKLIESEATITAIELDDDLLPILENEFGDKENFTLIHENALNYSPKEESYKIVANIPYYITSPLLNHFLLEQFQNGQPPQSIVIMIQKEVAEKILAEKGKHSVLSLQVHLFGDPELICIVPKEAFDPIPKVDSAVIKINVHSAPKIEGDLKKIFWLFHVSFAQKRKKLANNLGSALRKKPAEIKTMLEKIDIHPDIRAEDLTLDEWQRLHQELDKIG